MSFLPLRVIASAALVFSTTHAAHADIDAQDVWSNWQTYFEGLGYEVSATQARSGATLTISDLTINVPATEETGASTVKMNEVAFTENGDGTVDIAIPPVMPIRMQVIGEDGETADVELELRQSGLVSTVSGVPTELSNTYAAQSVDIVLTGLTIDGEKQDAEVAAATIGMQDLSGTTRTTVGGNRVYDQDMQAVGVTYNLAFIDPEGDGDLKMDGQFADLGFTGSSAVPLVKLESSDMLAVLAAGGSTDGTFKYSAGASNVSVIDSGTEAFSAATTSDGGTLDVTLKEDGLAYSGGQNDLNVTITSPDFPVPIAFDMASASFNLATPVQKSEEASDFALGFSFNDFSMSDMLWGMFDPSAQLPRDPATIALDLTGKARLLFDFFDPAASGLTANSNIAPAEMETVDINKLQIKVAGAELTGNGAFRFDNSAPGGVPTPIGAADLKLSGGNKLLDTLVSMGFLPEEQAMGARMMMGLLAVPGAEPDTLNSRIEMNEQGHVLANGQRIQ